MQNVATGSSTTPTVVKIMAAASGTPTATKVGTSSPQVAKVVMVTMAPTPTSVVVSQTSAASSPQVGIRSIFAAPVVSATPTANIKVESQDSAEPPS